MIECFNVANALQGVGDPTKSPFQNTVSKVGAGVDAGIVSANAMIAIAKLFGAMTDAKVL